MRPQLFIEKIMPVKLLNKQVYYEHGGNPFKGLHRWYSRKPLSFSRASVLASLLPADISMEEFLYVMGLYGEDEVRFWEKSAKTEEDKDKLRNIKEVRLYKNPPSAKQLKRFNELCQRTWGKEKPAILDQFAGGGSIPFEGVRYGLNVYASDLNPVAVMTMKAAMDYPLKFGADLQKDLDRWVKWVGDEAETRLSEFFPNSPLSVPSKEEGESKAPLNKGETKAPLNKGSVQGDLETETKAPLNKGGRGDLETVQNYLWAHTVTCPHCNSTLPLSPNWWLYKRPEKQNLHKWCAVKPIPNLAEKRVDFELIKGQKGKGTTIKTESGDFDPNVYNTVARGVAKCCNCGNVIEDNIIKKQAQNEGLGHQLYAVAYKKGKGSLEFRIPNQTDLDGVNKAEEFFQKQLEEYNLNQLIPEEERLDGYADRCIAYGLLKHSDYFNPRQLLTLVTYVAIINEAKLKIQAEYEPEKAQAIITYLALVLDRCVDTNGRLSHWHSSRACAERASAQHSLNLMWNYPELSGSGNLWYQCADAFASDFTTLCEYINNQNPLNQLPLLTENKEENPPLTPPGELNTGAPLNKGGRGDLEGLKNPPLAPPSEGGEREEKIPQNPPYQGGECGVNINLESADSLYHLPDKSIEAIITDPPYYGTIQYAELSDFFYVWQKRTLGDIFPEIFWLELTDKDREAVANPSRFRNMGESADELAKQDYEAKMNMAWSEAYRVLKDDGVLTVQFNHKDSGAWDVLTKALIDAGFEITASWAVSTENPQNLHQAKKNSVSSTVILVCRKRDINAEQAWWDDLRPEVRNIVEARAPEFEDNEIEGINLYLSAFGPALNVFSKSYPILTSTGQEVRPEAAFSEARKAIANYRFRKLVQTDTMGFDALTQWYLLAWDAFGAREFPFDEARQLALAIGGFNVNDLAKEYKLLDSASGTCKLLTPQQILKKRAFSINIQEFSSKYLVDSLHALIMFYATEENIKKVRSFYQDTGLVSNDMFAKTIEVAFKVIPKNVDEHQALLNLWLNMDEIKSKIVYQQMELKLNETGQMSLDL